MWEKICAYLTFTRKERLGMLVLLVIIILLFIVPYFFRPEIGSKDPVASEKYPEGIRKFQSADRGGSDEKKDLPNMYTDHLYADKDQPGAYLEKISSSRDQMHYASGENSQSGVVESRPTLFYFDPNRISGEDWHRLGLPDKLILTIAHYIQKGGSFRSASDLKKLYGLKMDDYLRLFPYVQIRERPPEDFPEHRMRSEWTSDNNREPTSQNLFGMHARSAMLWGKKSKSSAENPPNGTIYFKSKDLKTAFNRKIDSADNPDYTDPSSKYSPYAYPGKKLEDLDINQADSSAWCRLPGIGIKLASRIIHFRDKLGGFYEVDQLRETFGLPDSTFQKIRPYLHAGSTDLQKINLNTAGQEILRAHPYIRWKLAKGIVQYREQHGGFKSVEELQQLAQIDLEKYKMLKHYMEVK